MAPEVHRQTESSAGNSPRVALVTGAARRIGASIARTLHAAGYSIAVHYRGSAGEARQLAGKLNQQRADSALTVQADLVDTQATRALIAQVLDQFGALDLLVNNASTFYASPLASIDDRQWDELLGSNLKGPVVLCQQAAEALAERGGSVVNIVDIHAERPLAGYSLYCAAKAGLIALTRSLALELAPRVRVNAVAPGAILWPEGDAALSEDARRQVVESTPLATSGEPGDIAGAVLYLARDAAFVTGQVLTVDGGRSL